MNLASVPPKDIQQPKPHIAVPIIETLKCAGVEENLSHLYANLLATSLDKATAYRTHPGFVDMIKNMCPDEGRIMRFLSTNSYCPLINIRSVSQIDQSFQVVFRNLSLISLVEIDIAVRM